MIVIGGRNASFEFAERVDVLTVSCPNDTPPSKWTFEWQSHKIRFIQPRVLSSMVFFNSSIFMYVDIKMALIISDLAARMATTMFRRTATSIDWTLRNTQTPPWPSRPL
jgi:hypothetical protein